MLKGLFCAEMPDFIELFLGFFAQEWLSVQWFMPETLAGFDWEKPLFLYFIPALPLIYILRWLLHFKFRQKLEIAVPEHQSPTDWTAYLRHIPNILMMTGLALIFVALARPQKTDEEVEQWTEGIDIVLVLDISESMQIEDFRPNRLEAAKKTAHDFIAGRFRDRIGMVIFSGEAFTLAPLTTDYELLNKLIETISFDNIRSRGTAIGSALAVAINRMDESESKSKVVILLSDGENTAGSLDPVMAAKLAYTYGIKIYTIGIGREGEVPFGTDRFGQTRYISNSMDETSLREIAKIGEGKYFRATNNRALENIFKQIDSYEKAEIKESRFKDTKDFYRIYLLWAALCLTFWMLLKSTFLTNALED